MTWTPHVTVAAVIQENDRFLLVQEKSDEGIVVNQPAGHWENDETLVEAVIRETREETGYLFSPEGLVGCYQWKVPKKDITYLRFCFYGQTIEYDDKQPLDEGIISADWLTLHELQSGRFKKRSPMVMGCINDYLSEKRYPLELLNIIYD